MIGCGVLQARTRASELSLFVLLGAVVVVTTVEIRVKWGLYMFLLALLNADLTSMGVKFCKGPSSCDMNVRMSDTSLISRPLFPL
jgi:hypothetical protein